MARSRLWAWVVWVTVCVAATLVLRERRDGVDTVHAVLTYQLVILCGSVSGGRHLVLVLTLAGFLLIDYFFQLPYDTLSVSKPLDWIVLLAFLTTAVVTTHLLTQERTRAAEAERRAGEVASLGRLGAELLSTGRAEDSLAGIADLIRTSLEVAHCRIYGRDDEAERLLVSSPAAATTEAGLPDLDDLRRFAEPTDRLDLAQEGALRGDRNALAIEEQADRLGHLVADLLDLSRLKGGAMPVHLELNTAEDLVGAAMRQMAGLLKDRRVETSVDFTEPALAGRFDFVQSLRILSNLLGNAVRYTPPASPIELSVHRDGAALVFVVADHGPGIPVPERDRIFEPFYRPAGAPADGGGAGLGLAIARRLAELQSGTLEYAARPGGGSRFVLRLPADAPL